MKRKRRMANRESYKGKYIAISQVTREVLMDKLQDKRVNEKKINILLRNPAEEPFDGRFDNRRVIGKLNRRVIGKLNYLEKCNRVEVTGATHQCARFESEPKDVHGKTVKWIGRYLAGTRDKTLVLKPDKSKGLNWQEQGTRA